MQFVKSGPSIPERLLHAHEEGRVVFFCGAGISRLADLPTFGGLVDDIYKELGEIPTEIEEEAKDKHQYDAVLDLLERRNQSYRLQVRLAAARVLKPKLKRKNAISTHEAVLTLARDRAGATRLVTTNFDRIFETVLGRQRSSIARFTAPLLPVPKPTRWDGLVYLHGLLQPKNDAATLNRLVLTSGDFGLAYLTERWASRFVSELFRNFVVCFVGYGINDPVLRYMMDALAADRMLGETVLEAFAFAEYEAGKEEKKRIEWKAKGVTPILYQDVGGPHGHTLLHESLGKWAETFRDGVIGKERIASDLAIARPTLSTVEDDFVGRLIWALSDSTGLPARRFAEFDPVPTIDWLEYFEFDRYQHRDLPRFDVPIERELTTKLQFSLVRRPAPFVLAPWMALLQQGFGGSQWDRVMLALCDWLLRHLGDPALFWWVIRKNGPLHPRFILAYNARIDEIERLEAAGDSAALARIRTAAPNAIPVLALRRLWDFLIAGRVKYHQDFDLYRWRNRLVRNGLSTNLRMELRRLLTPCVVLHPRREPQEGSQALRDDSSIQEIAQGEVVLRSNYTTNHVKELQGVHEWLVALPHLLWDLQSLLLDALDLMADLGQANAESDRAHYDMPSIAPHFQNRDFHDWVALIHLLRDAWLALLETDRDRAAECLLIWRRLGYPTFFRLALFGATYRQADRAGLWAEWLIEGESWWLWSVETQREVMQLLKLRGGDLDRDRAIALQDAILVGPPRRMFREDLGPDTWTQLRSHSIWLRLAKLSSAGVALTAPAAKRFKELNAEHPMWQVASDESDEFSHWMVGTGDPGFIPYRSFSNAPRDLPGLVAWLQLPPSHEFMHADDWSDVCRGSFRLAARALKALAAQNVWPAERWRTALQTWSADQTLRASCRVLGKWVSRMPDQQLLEISSSASWWLEAWAKLKEPEHAAFYGVCDRFLALDFSTLGGVGSELVDALNHPLGRVAQALLDRWFQIAPVDDQRLPEHLATRFVKICQGGEVFRAARVILAVHVIALYRVDPGWTIGNLLPRFDWRSEPDEAKECWNGFLWGPRLYAPLFNALKREFLDTSEHYNDLDDHRRQYAAILTYVCLDPFDIFSETELQAALANLPLEALEAVAHTLVQALEGASGQREVYWANRVKPVLTRLWPRDRDLTESAIPEYLAQLAVAAGAKFPDALETVEARLTRGGHHFRLIDQLVASKLPDEFPVQMLKLLDSVISIEADWLPPDLAKVLERAAAASPEITVDHRYRDLLNFVRIHDR